MNSFGDDPIEFLMNVTKEVSNVLKYATYYNIYLVPADRLLF